MRVLVTFAVEAEFAPWRKRHGFVERKIQAQAFSADQQTVYGGKIGSSTVDVLLTGIGWDRYADNSARHGLRALLKDKPDLCISTGLAGGLRPEYRTGDVVVATEVCSSQKGSTIRSHERLLSIAQSCGAVAGRLMTWRRIVAESKAKKAMGLFADIVDMETFFVMTAVSGSQVPSVGVRAISDTCEEDLPIDFTRVLDRKGNLRKKELLGELGRNPRRIPALVQFGKRSREATERLADFLDLFVPAIEEKFTNSWRQPRQRAASR
jgi:adenosylhomocysteine nucleosidase